MSTKLQNPKKQLMRFKLLAGSHEQRSATDPNVTEKFQAPRPFGYKDKATGEQMFDPDTIVESAVDLEKMFNFEGIKKFERVYDNPQQQIVATRTQLVDYNALKGKDQKALLEFCRKYDLPVVESMTSKEELLALIKTNLGAE